MICQKYISKVLFENNYHDDITKYKIDIYLFTTSKTIKISFEKQVNDKIVPLGK